MARARITMSGQRNALPVFSGEDGNFEFTGVKVQYMRNWNRGYLHWAQDHGLIRYTDPVNLHLYSEVLQRFRLAAEGRFLS